MHSFKFITNVFKAIATAVLLSLIFCSETSGKIFFEYSSTGARIRQYSESILMKNKKLDKKTLKIKVTPNPVIDIANIDIEGSTDSIFASENQLSVFSLDGDHSISVAFKGNSTTVDMSKFPRGIYVITISNADSMVVNGKIIKN